jgi:lysophospholipase L1-like esterase
VRTFAGPGRIVAVSVAVCVTAVVAASCGSTVDSPRVLVVGDSILNQSADPVRAELEADGWAPVVIAFGGSAIEQWTERLPQLLAEHSPSIVVVELGTNDCTDGVCPQLDAQIAQALDALADAEQILWLNVQTGPTYPAGAERINAALEQAAAARANLRIVDFSDTFADHAAWLDDGGPHLTPAGQRAFARLITDAVDDFDVSG